MRSYLSHSLAILVAAILVTLAALTLLSPVPPIDPNAPAETMPSRSAKPTAQAIHGALPGMPDSTAREASDGRVVPRRGTTPSTGVAAAASTLTP